MSANDEAQELVRNMIGDAAAWASGQPWTLGAEQVRLSRPRRWSGPPGTVGRQKGAVLAEPLRPWRMPLVIGTVVALVVAVALAVAISAGTASVRLRLASYSLRLPSRFHLTLDQQTVCEMTTPLWLPNGGGGGSPPPAVAVGPDGGCVVMAILPPVKGVGTTPARLVANTRPVMVNGHKGLIGMQALHGFYDVHPGGMGGPFQKIAGLHKVDEILVVLTLVVPVGHHVGDLAIVEHGLSEKRLLSIVSSGLVADIA